MQGDFVSSQIPTHIAISGEGFFAVKERTALVDGSPVFAGASAYTRRGDFEISNNGYLVTNKATDTLDYVISLADAPYSDMSRNVVNMRAEKPADSFRQTVQMVPGLVNHIDTILQKVDVDFVIGSKFVSAFAGALAESGIQALQGTPETPPDPVPELPPADPVVGIPPMRK